MSAPDRRARLDVSAPWLGLGRPQGVPLHPSDTESLTLPRFAPWWTAGCRKPPPRASSTPRPKPSPNGSDGSAPKATRVCATARQGLGVRVERVMTDNGSCYISRAFAQACRTLGLKHIRTKPYTPKTNGKAERFIQTSLREWAYAQAYNSSDERTAELPRWLHRYNWHRPHGSLDAKPPHQPPRLDRE